MSTLLDTAEAALAELRTLHGHATHYCCGPEHCPTARAIHDLAASIADAKFPTGPEATYGGGIIVKDMDPRDVADAILRANFPPAANDSPDLGDFPGIHPA